MDNLKKLFTLIGNLLTWTEEAFLCLLLVAMILLACVQIFLRTFYSSGILWADPLLRYMGHLGWPVWCCSCHKTIQTHQH
jgi:TRAP-type C4-dicarboxylate transport system permease small subunit